jgi:hypothetical protein
MPFSRIAELRIRDAMEQGRFDDLPGAGKPLDLEEYFSVPEDMRMAYSILKNADVRLDERMLHQMLEARRRERAMTSGRSPGGAPVRRFPDRPLR